MIYLFFQIWIWMLLAVALGLAAGWFIWGRGASATIDNENASIDTDSDTDSDSGETHESIETSEKLNEYEDDSKLVQSESDELSSQEPGHESRHESQNDFGSNSDEDDTVLDNAKDSNTTNKESVSEGVTREIPRDESVDNLETDSLMFVSASDQEPDDLKQIRGIGLVLAKVLNELGIFHYEQIANFSREEIARVDNHLSFSGRIDRENWVDQAKNLVRARSSDTSEN